jgi:glycosyltransferase involved in cell wall biosynthesis
VHSLTIVTINRNNSTGLQETLTSIVNQTYSAINLVVVDGASSDDSLKVIDKITNNNSKMQVCVISEKDNGIYNAMNKGINHSDGDYIFFLNSGDRFLEENVVENVFSQVDKEDVVYGNICLSVRGKIKVLNSNPEIRFFDRYQHDMPPHPAIFIKTNKIREIGGFNERYKIVSDVALIMTLFSDKNLKYRFNLQRTSTFYFESLPKLS